MSFKWILIVQFLLYLGAAVGLFYACLFPKSVERIIALDMIKPLTFPSNKLAAKTREGIEQFLQLEAKTMSTNNSVTNGSADSSPTNSSIPLYDLDQAVIKLIQAHSVFGQITPEGAKLLLIRGSKPSSKDPNKVYFTRDNRLKAMLFQRMDNDALVNYFNQLNCELLIVKAENGVKLDPEEVSNRFIELYSKQCARFELVKVPGGHHVHLCEPEHVYPKIINFIGHITYQNGKA